MLGSVVLALTLNPFPRRRETLHPVSFLPKEKVLGDEVKHQFSS